MTPAKNLHKLLALYKESLKLNPSDMDYEFGKLLEYRSALLGFAKFKADDEVALKFTPIIDDKTNSGWIGHKDMLVVGAKAIVREVDYALGRFVYALEFNQKPNRTFSFGEEWLEKYYHREKYRGNCRICGVTASHIHTDGKTYVMNGFECDANANRMFLNFKEKIEAHDHTSDDCVMP